MAWESMAGSSIKVDYDKLFGRSPTNQVASNTNVQNPVGSTAGASNATDLSKAYQNIYNSSPQAATNSQMNNYTNSQGQVYNTSGLNSQQSYAAQLAIDKNPNAEAILRGMGLNLNGDPITYNQGLASNLPNYAAATSTANTAKPATTSTPTGSSFSAGNGTGYNSAMTGGTGNYTVQASSNPTPAAQKYDVNDPAFQALPADQRKQILAADPALMQQELQRASDVWFANQGNDGQQTDEQKHNQALAHQWAEELRATQQQAPSSGGSTGQAGSGGANPATTGLGQVLNSNQQQTDEFKSLLNSILTQMNGGGATNANLQNVANQQGQDIWNQKQAQYQQLINSLKSGQANDLQSIANQTDSSRQQIEDRTFQNWLASRQNVANRGLGNSGAASDADTRSILARQRDLSGLFNTQTDAVNKTNRGYTDQLNKATVDMANNNLSSTQAEIFQKLFKDSQGSMSDQLKAITDLLGKQLGYSQVNPADYIKAQTSIYDTDARTKTAYAKLDQSDRQFYDKLAQENQKMGIQALQWQAEYGLKSAQIFGQDANGNPTLDAQKFVAEVAQKQAAQNETNRHNQASEGIGWAGVQNTRDSIAARLKDINLQADKFDESKKMDGMKFKSDSFKEIISTESKNLLDLRDSLDKNPNNQSIKNQYDTAVNRLNAAMRGLDNLAQTGLGDNYSGGGDTAATGTSETAGLKLADDYITPIQIQLNNGGGNSSVTQNVFGNN